MDKNIKERLEAFGRDYSAFCAAIMTAEELGVGFMDVILQLPANSVAQIISDIERGGFEELERLRVLVNTSAILSEEEDEIAESIISRLNFGG